MRIVNLSQRCTSKRDGENFGNATVPLNSPQLGRPNPSTWRVHGSPGRQQTRRLSRPQDPKSTGSIMSTNDENIGRVHEAAREAHRAGLCILPPAEDGTKRPLPNANGEWSKYKTEPPTGRTPCMVPGA